MSWRKYIWPVSFWSAILNGLQICVYLLGLFLFVWMLVRLHVALVHGNWPPTVEKISAWAQVVVAYAAIFAIGQYAVAYAEVADRKTKSVLEYVKFFRETILEKGSQIKIYVRKNKITVPLRVRLTKTTPILKFTPSEFFNRIAPNQNGGLVKEYHQFLAENLEFESLVLSCLNSIEEFSIGILNTKSADHKAVASIKKPFVEMVEELSVPLYFQIGENADQFSYTSDLYQRWKKEIGFIPQDKEDRIDRYEERKRLYFKQ